MGRRPLGKRRAWLVGTATFVRKDGKKRQHGGSVFGVYVTPEARKKGISRELMQFMIERVKGYAGLGQLTLAVAHTQGVARNLYRSLGFEVWGVEKGALKIEGQYTDLEHMVLRLRRPEQAPSIYARAQDKIAELKAELRGLGYWQTDPLRPEQYQFKQAFGTDTMAFTQWLQFVLIPRVRAIINNQEEFPDTNQVGAQAVREFDGVPEARGLVALLSEFDALF